jgi:hypothetical protein
MSIEAGDTYHLIVLSASDVEATIRPLHNQVTGKVPPERTVGSPSYMIYKGLGRFLLIAQVPACSNRTLNQKFTNTPNGKSAVAVFGIYYPQMATDWETNVLGV